MKRSLYTACRLKLAGVLAKEVSGARELLGAKSFHGARSDRERTRFDGCSRRVRHPILYSMVRYDLMFSALENHKDDTRSGGQLNDRAGSLFTADHEAFRETVKKFIEREIRPYHYQWEEDGIVPRELWNKAGEAGLLCCTVPEEYGGLGLDYLFDVVVFEETARSGFTGPGFLIHCDLVATYIKSVRKNRSASGCRRWSAAKPSARWG